MFIRSCLQFNPISIKRNNKRYHHKNKYDNQRYTRQYGCCFNTSSARSPPTNIRENGNRHNANAQNKRLAFNGSPITFSEMRPKIYEPESNVVAKNKNAEIKNNTTINDENGN